MDAPIICLSFDTDHLNEDGMAQFLSAYQLPGRATFFCTQAYRDLAGTDHEIGPHPFLAVGCDWEKELEACRNEFPNAVGWRSHSCVFSHRIAEWLHRRGYRYASVFDEFGTTGLRPNRLSWGVWHLPIYYMDTLDLGRMKFWPGHTARPFDPELIERALQLPGLYVFDIHPFHVLLNTPNVEFYRDASASFRRGADLRRLRFPGRGAATFFEALCDRMRSSGIFSLTMCEALERTKHWSDHASQAGSK